jgi:hypothetical protein
MILFAKRVVALFALALSVAATAQNTLTGNKKPIIPWMLPWT